MEKIVKGATKIKLAAPKAKYVEPILSATAGGDSGVADVFNTLQLRLRDSTWTIVFKSLIIVHLMIRDGQPEVTLRFLADSPKRLAISSFTEIQTQGVNIKRYYEYLMERVRAYRDTKTDFVKSGASKMRGLTVDKGLLRQTESVQGQIQALLECDFIANHDPDNEISLTAFRLLTMDLLELFKVMNEGTINVLEHYFEMSRPDAERALSIYKTFGQQTDQVVSYLSLARQYSQSTKLEVPRLKHAPTTLTSSLEEYLRDPDFEVNRRQYLAQQDAKRTGKPIPKAQEPPRTVSATPSTVNRSTVTAPPKGPAPDLIDFFESIERDQQPMAQENSMPQQQFNNGLQQPQFQQPQQTGYNPFMQNFSPQAQAPQLQPDFTGAGFGGYGPQPQPQPQQQPQPQYTSSAGFPSQLAAIPQGGIMSFEPQQMQQQQSQLSSPSALQPQPTSTNPFRQLSIPVGIPQNGNLSNVHPQSTNPFASQSTGQQSSFDQTSSSFQPTYTQQLDQNGSAFFNSQQQVQTISPPPIQAQRTGTNPFARNLSPPPTNPINVNVTGSTNPFRQSQFVNQQTGQGWQHTNQGTFGGYNVNAVDTTPIFPRPGQG